MAPCNTGDRQPRTLTMSLDGQSDSLRMAPVEEEEVGIGPRRCTLCWPDYEVKLSEGPTPVNFLTSLSFRPAQSSLVTEGETRNRRRLRRQALLYSQERDCVQR